MAQALKIGNETVPLMSESHGKSLTQTVLYPLRDMEGTIADSKSSLNGEMSGLLHDLLGIVKVAVISGGDWPQFEKQVVTKLPHDERLRDGELWRSGQDLC